MSSQKVLCIENHKIFSEYLQLLLAKEEAFEVDMAQSLAAGLKKIRDQDTPYGAILLDLGLDDSNGVDTLIQVKSRTKSPIVVFSSHDELEQECLRHGAYAFLIKGCPAYEIGSKLIEAMASTTSIVAPKVKSRIHQRLVGKDNGGGRELATVGGINAVIACFVAFCLYDWYQDVYIKHIPWQPKDWEISVCVAGAGMKTIYETTKKKD